MNVWSKDCRHIEISENTKKEGMKMMNEYATMSTKNRDYENEVTPPEKPTIKMDLDKIIECLYETHSILDGIVNGISGNPRNDFDMKERKCMADDTGFCVDIAKRCLGLTLALNGMLF